MEDFSTSELTTLAKRLFECRDESDLDTPEDDSDPELTGAEQDFIDDVCAETELEYVGFGGNRVSFTHPEWDSVVLLPRWGPEGDTFHSGKAANNNEIHLFTTFEEEEMDFPLLPITEYQDDGWWVVKPTITPVIEDSEAVQSDWEEYGKEELWDELFPCNDHINMMDITSANACFWNGEFTLFDYGTRPVEV